MRHKVLRGVLLLTLLLLQAAGASGQEPVAVSPGSAMGSLIGDTWGSVADRLLAGASAGQQLDENSQVYWAHRAFEAEATESHPKKMVLAQAPSEEFELASCTIRYDLRRVDAGLPDLKNGGRMKVTLEIRRGENTLKVGRKKVKVRAVEPSQRKATFAWADESGWTGEGPGTATDRLPVELEPGDLVVWTVKFKGMPKPEPGAFFSSGDSADLSVVCSNCWTNARPCVWPEDYNYW